MIMALQMMKCLCCGDVLEESQIETVRVGVDMRHDNPYWDEENAFEHLCRICGAHESFREVELCES